PLEDPAALADPEARPGPGVRADRAGLRVLPDPWARRDPVDPLVPAARVARPVPAAPGCRDNRTGQPRRHRSNPLRLRRGRHRSRPNRRHLAPPACPSRPEARPGPAALPRRSGPARRWGRATRWGRARPVDRGDPAAPWDPAHPPGPADPPVRAARRTRPLPW